MKLSFARERELGATRGKLKASLLRSSPPLLRLSTRLGRQRHSRQQSSNTARGAAPHHLPSPASPANPRFSTSPSPRGGSSLPPPSQRALSAHRMITYRPSTRLKLLLFPVALLTLLLLTRSSFSPPPLHPIPSLLSTASTTYSTLLSTRSTTLRAAYDRYLSTHGRQPPKGFDSWFWAGRRNGVCNLDRFGEMYRSLEPWWAMRPLFCLQ